MPPPKRLVLFVEGEADVAAAPTLVTRLLTELQGWDAVQLDKRPPFMVGNVEELMARESQSGRGRQRQAIQPTETNWVRYLNRARAARDLGGVLLLADGDRERVEGQLFCPARVGHRLAELARQAGGGSLFSVACVFACQEYESWLIACADRLAGLPLPDGRPGIRPGPVLPANVEQAPRDAKRWLQTNMEGGYKNTDDQLPLTQLMIHHLDALRDREVRSFRRLETALAQIVEAVRSGSHIVSPVLPPGG